ncbi:MAG TPA: sigma-70 family RNA polymerase sigma factor [Acidimicrobiales bacterium]|nr:sigma-70 family RNA polymerase sigma factor [Acidimicrobiales bacterium]
MDAPAPEAGEVYRQLAPAVLGYLRAQRAIEPEDLLGEVFLQVARDLPRFSGDDDALRRWVFTIAHHRLIDDRRRRARRPQLADGEVPEAAAPELADAVDPALIAALDRLTADQREVVLLRFVADLPLEAVAKLTKRNVGAVKALQHRALEQLGRILRASADAHDGDD